MKITDRQPARTGDSFRTAGALVIVRRVSRNPSNPWADIEVITDTGSAWTKRMPAGIPASWEYLGGAA